MQVSQAPYASPLPIPIIRFRPATAAIVRRRNAVTKAPIRAGTLALMTASRLGSMGVDGAGRPGRAIVPELLEGACGLNRVAFIFNPVSGPQGGGPPRRTRLEQLARAAGLTCDLTETDPETGARDLARQAAEDGAERVLISGGDGTVAEAAEALAGTDVAVAMIPGGTGNLLAANFGIPLDSEAALRLALTGTPKKVDVGRANGHVFLLLAGMGADARMIRDADRRLKQRFGALAYFIAAFKNFGRPLSRYRITVDGVTISRRAQTVLVANLGRITAGVELIPGADPTDGLLEVAIIRTRTFRDAAMVILRSLLGKHQSDNLTEIIRGRHVIIEPRRPQPTEVDGNDIGTCARLEVTVEPGALSLVVPAQPALYPDPAALMAEVATQPIWLPVAAGTATAIALSARKRRLQNAGQKPDRFTKHPWLTGTLVGLAAGLVVTALKRRPSPPQEH